MPSPDTFPALLQAELRVDPARPFVTFYDHDSGERVELSLTTYANWVAKTAGLLQDELDGERGGLVLVDLPTHWLGAVWLGAVWSVGMAVTDDPGLADEADLVVCGPDGVAAYAEHAGRVPVVALSLRPLGARFAEPLPTGVVDYGAVVLAQPDAFVARHPPAAGDAAWRAGAVTSTQADLLAAARDSDLLRDGGRLLTDVNPVRATGLRTLLSPLGRRGGTVWVRHPEPTRWDALAEQERVTDRLRAR
ncbi:MAG: TIGR03089 family protein [Nocardioidaceae bacterium]|nr:TIGR03089 family protein [Nocardioidaceae bacterium]